MKKEVRNLYYKRKSKIARLTRRVVNAKKRIRRLRMLLRITLIFGLIYLSYFILSLNCWKFDLNDVSNLNPQIISVSGNNIVQYEKIAGVISEFEFPDYQIFKFSTKKIEKELEKLQPIKNVYIRRFFAPARIIVFIQERTPVFLIAPNNDTPPISAITRDGHYIGREFMPIPSKFKTTKILSYGTGDDDYENWDKKRVDEILKFIRKIETYSSQKVEYIDLRNKNDIYIKLEEDTLRIGAMDDNLDDRIKWIPTILPEIKTLKQKVKYIDLRWKGANYIKLDSENKNSKKPKE